MLNAGKINSLDKFNEIKRLDKGVILITDDTTGNHVHLPNCIHVTEENYKEKVIQNNSEHCEYYWYNNISHTLKEHIDFTSCLVCNPDSSERTSALNESGTFLQISVLNQLKNHNWDPKPEFPTSLAPFLKDPMKYPGIFATTPGVVRPSMFQQAVSESQNQFLKKETSIDALGGRFVNNSNYLLCSQVKKLNPKYVDWCFFQQSSLDNKFRVTTKSTIGDGLVDLMTIPDTDRREGKNVHIQIEQLNIPGLTFTCSDFGVALHRDPNNKTYKFQNSSLNNAVIQCIEGTYGIIVNALVHQVSTGDGYDTDSQIYIPLVVTNANLLYCDYNVNNIDSLTGKITDLNFKSLDHIVYEYALPMSVQFPKSVLGTRSPEQLSMAIRWPVLITNPVGLESLLSTMDTSIFVPS